jgi:hypothetical protein
MNDLQTWINTAVANALVQVEPRAADGGYHLWRYSSFNTYRGVIELEKSTPTKVADLETEIRGIVAKEFRPKRSWLRGFAFGACVAAPLFPRDAERLPDCIDIYNRFGGVWQWLVYVAMDQRLACAIHTWSEGYLSPVLRRLVGEIEASGISCPTFVRKKGPIFGFAEAIGRQPLQDFRHPR